MVERLDPAVGDVRMGVDEPGGRRSAVQIDPPRVGTGETQDVAIGPDGHDPAGAHRQRLGNVIAGIDGEDFAVDQHQIGRRRARWPAGTKPVSAGGAAAGALPESPWLD